MSFWEMIVYTIDYCNTISPRYLIYFLVNTFIYIKYGFWIWKILDCIMIFVLMKCISYLFVKNKELNIIVGLLVCMYPFMDMATAGPLSTTVGYLWVLAAAMVSFACLKKLTRNRWKWYEIILYVVSVLYASSQEQMCLCLIPIFILLCAYGRKNCRKDIVMWSAAGEGITLINVYILFRGAADSGRSFEAAMFFPDFYSLSFINKLEMAFSSTMDRVVFDYGIFGILSLCICFFLWKKYRMLLIRGTSMLPFVLFVIGKWKWNSGFFSKLKSLINTSIGNTVKYGLIDVENYSGIRGYISLGILCLIGGMTILNILLLDNRKGKGLVGILLLGMVTRMSLLVTPNIYASSTRTYIFLWFALIVVIICIIDGQYQSSVLPYMEKYRIAAGAVRFIAPIVVVAFLASNMDETLRLIETIR